MKTLKSLSTNDLIIGGLSLAGISAVVVKLAFYVVANWDAILISLR